MTEEYRRHFHPRYFPVVEECEADCQYCEEEEQQREAAEAMGYDPAGDYRK